MYVNVYDAKTNFSRLISSVMNGKEDIIISKNGKPVVRMIPYIEENSQNRIGIAKGKLPELNMEVFNRLDEGMDDLFLGGMSL